MSAQRIRCVISIAGSDSGGGAGIQADLKTFARCGVHGTTAVTAITAQDTVGVDAIQLVDPEMVRAQVRAVARDIGVDAVKIGMLGDAATIIVVCEAIDELPPWTPVVLDPVMVAESGARLLPDEAHELLIELLVPRATVVTPNVPEARALAEGAERVSSLVAAATPPWDDDIEQLARAVHALGPQCVVVTGGHRDAATDLFFDGKRSIAIRGERYANGASHGSGCCHSSALAAALAQGLPELEAAQFAKQIAAAAIRDGLRELGAGSGPVDPLGIRAAEPLGIRTAERLS